MGRNCCWEAAGRDRAVKLGRVRAWRRSRHRDFDSRSSPMAGQGTRGTSSLLDADLATSQASLSPACFSRFGRLLGRSPPLRRGPASRTKPQNEFRQGVNVGFDLALIDNLPGLTGSALQRHFEIDAPLRWRRKLQFPEIQIRVDKRYAIHVPAKVF